MKRMRLWNALILASIIIATGVLQFVTTGFCSERHLRFVTVAWEPYYGPNLLSQGYVAEITRAALWRVGYTMQIDFVPWKRALHDAKNGYYNGVLGLFYSDERAEWMAYSESIASDQLVFFAKKGRMISWEKLEDLKLVTIGTEQGFVYTDEFDSAVFLKKEPVRNVELNLKKLLENRIDLVAASRNVFLHWINTESPDKLEQVQVIPKQLSENKIYNGFLKNDPLYETYVMDFNRGLQEIKADGTLAVIMKKHGLN
jgi:polar amino acid transport system substrate-binding protein